MKILDATASVRSIWYQKNYKDTVFFDKRNGKYYENHEDYVDEVCNYSPRVEE